MKVVVWGLNCSRRWCMGVLRVFCMVLSETDGGRRGELCCTNDRINVICGIAMRMDVKPHMNKTTRHRNRQEQ